MKGIDMAKDPFCSKAHAADPAHLEQVVVGANGGLANVVLYISVWSGSAQASTPFQSSIKRIANTAGPIASALPTAYHGRSSLQKGAPGRLPKKATMKLSRSIWILSIALVGLITLLAPVPAFAQSCALCYTQAASSGSRMIQALRSGILILIAPPTLMSIGLIFVCYRKRNQTRDDDANESDREWESHNDSSNDF